MKMLNVGCGTRFHKDWTNIDMVSTAEGVIAVNLLKGIPFDTDTFDLVYHSHVLEHFTREDGAHFVSECVRVLKPGGVLRISTPDLENIAREYIANLEASVSGDKEANERYEWNLLEMYDQTVRNKSQGKMGEVLKSKDLPGEEYIKARVGYEGVLLRNGIASGGNAVQPVKKSVLKKLLGPTVWKNQLLKLVLGKEGFDTYELGKFRKGGEIHLMMYDRYSLDKLLKKLGMKDIKVVNAAQSRVDDWGKYDLDRQDGSDYKPFSLIMEATKA